MVVAHRIKTEMKNCDGVRESFRVVSINGDELQDTYAAHEVGDQVKEKDLDQHQGHINHGLGEGICSGSVEGETFVLEQDGLR